MREGVEKKKGEIPPGKKGKKFWGGVGREPKRNSLWEGLNLDGFPEKRESVKIREKGQPPKGG